MTPPPLFNDVTMTYDDEDDDERGGGVIIDSNHGNDGVVSDLDDKPNEDDDRIQQSIYHGMGGTYNFFLLLHSK